jgi:hypothetical protein
MIRQKPHAAPLRPLPQPVTEPFMKDTVDATTCLGHRFGIVYIGLNKVHRLEADQILMLSGDKVVDTANLLAARQQFRCDRPAYEAGCASH